MGWFKRLAKPRQSVPFKQSGSTGLQRQDFFLKMMPPVLPVPLALVWISGGFEILGGLGLLVPQTRRFSSWGLIALLIAVYPANIHMMLNPEQFAEFASPLALYIRMPFQFVFIAWAWWIGRPEPSAK